MKFYPLKFKPVYKEKIWGGNKLKQNFGRNLPANNIGESWEITAHPNGMSVVASGKLSGKKLTELLDKYYQEMMGKITVNSKRQFPLLIKILDANQKLSVQVHPDNDYAQKVEGEPGKTEMWYVISAEPGAKLVYGLKAGTDKNDMKTAIENGNLEKYLNEVPVSAGDIFFMPSGTIHAIEEGILLAEIQQNSDTTYRVYDWNRMGQNGKPRDLHIDKALEVTNFNQHPLQAKSQPLTIERNNYTQHILTACPYFITEKIDIKNKYALSPNGERFYIIMALSGSGKIKYKDQNYNISAGETIFIPAALENVSINGNLEILNSYLPENKENTISYLKNLGFKQKEIDSLAGIENWQ